MQEYNDSVVPTLRADDRHDAELIENGDFRNVTDAYRNWTVDAIKADLDTKRFDLQIAIENFQHDFNIGTIVRTSNAFNVSGVHIIGKKHWNRRGAMVTDRYMSIHHHKTVQEFVGAMDDRTIIAVDNFPGAVPLRSALFPSRAVLVFGGEGPGLSFEMQQAATQMVCIEQFGSTRSINVGVAAGILMYEWMKQHVFTKVDLD